MHGQNKAAPPPEVGSRVVSVKNKSRVSSLPVYKTSKLGGVIISKL